jgi:DNA helicase IV
MLRKAKFIEDWANEQKLHLDLEQAAAVAETIGNTLVVARAGSGKTRTIITRALFLIKHCYISPYEILLLAFNRKAAGEIRRRLLEALDERAKDAVTAEVNRQIHEIGKHRKIDKGEIEANAVDAIASKLNVMLPHVMTYHSLAYAIVHPEESILFDSANGESQSLSRVIQQVIDDHFQKPAFKMKIRKLMLAHFREAWDRIIEGCYDKSKAEFLQFRRSLPRESLRGEYVKSFGEKIIADFLFEHDVAYKYECNHWWGGINYRPDFTIFKTTKSGIIIEYFGLKGDTDYDEMSQRKQDYWKTKQGWTLLEISPQDIMDKGKESFLTVLKDRLQAQGIVCVRLSEDEIWHKIHYRAIDRFTIAITGFIGRCQKQILPPSELRHQLHNYSPVSPIEGIFLEIAHHLYATYLDRLSATGEEDFDGLVQHAADTIVAGKTLFQKKSICGDLALLRHICIDEFQDFSKLFFQLLKAIRMHNSEIKLFCVGDDWQAINGFAGSDLRFFENFSANFGESVQREISTNHRSLDKIVTVGNALMDGLGKPAIAENKSAGKVFVADLNQFEPHPLEKQNHRGDIITPAVLRFSSKAIADGLNVVLLCRRNAIPWFVNYKDRVESGSRGLDLYLNHVRSFLPHDLKKRISISTTHKYKGLESGAVIVLDAIARSYPLIHPDWIFCRILGDSPEKIAKEERRLLYVALTRAVKELIIITDKRNKSPFLEEVERKQPLDAINWEDYPPVYDTKKCLIIKVGNQDHRRGTPTIAIKDQLKATGYQWQSTGWPAWAKSFPEENFCISILKSELWAESADGIEIRIFAREDSLVARYMLDKGQWKCDFDNLDNSLPV